MKKTVAFVLALALLFSCSCAAFAADDEINGFSPSGLLLEGDDILITDVFNKVVWSFDGTDLTRIGGAVNYTDVTNIPVAESSDGTLDSAYFSEPWDIEPFTSHLDVSGYAISDPESNTVRFMNDEYIVTMLGTGEAGSSDGKWTTTSSGRKAQFNYPTGLALSDEDGSLYIADTGNNSIRKLDIKGNVTTLVTGLCEPTGLDWYDGSLYVAETGRSRILKITGKQISVVAGISEKDEDGVYVGGFADGPVSAAKFDHPQGVLAADDGTIYVADTGNMSLRCIKDGRVYTMQKEQNDMSIAQPRDLIFKDGEIYVSDLFLGAVLVYDAELSKNFSDTQNDWYTQNIAEAAARGLISGYGDGSFKPQNKVTRAEFAKMISNMALALDGNTVINGEKTFPDVKEDSWYKDQAKWAADNGIINGSNGKFLGEDHLTREQLVMILYNFTGSYLEKDAAVGSDEKLISFKDHASVSNWAKDAMSWGVNNAVLSGSNGMLRPGDDVTRAEAATMLINYMNMLGL